MDTPTRQLRVPLRFGQALTAGLALGGLLLACASPRADGPGRPLYQWSDEDGGVRYTAQPEQVPTGQRHTLQEVVPGQSAPENAGPLHPVSTNAGATDPGVAAQPAPEPRPLEDRIAALEAAITQDENVLKALVSDPDPSAQDESAQLREIAGRLPKLQAELRALKAQREQSGEASGD